MSDIAGPLLWSQAWADSSASLTVGDDDGSDW